MVGQLETCRAWRARVARCRAPCRSVPRRRSPAPASLPARQPARPYYRQYLYYARHRLTVRQRYISFILSTIILNIANTIFLQCELAVRYISRYYILFSL